jgi:hypothetical protein
MSRWKKLLEWSSYLTFFLFSSIFIVSNASKNEMKLIVFTIIVALTIAIVSDLLILKEKSNIIRGILLLPKAHKANKLRKKFAQNPADTISNNNVNR